MKIFSELVAVTIVAATFAWSCLVTLATLKVAIWILFYWKW